MTITTTRKLYWDDLRSLCIAMNWYTHGTNADYEGLFDLIHHKEITDDLLTDIAVNIFEHSDIEDMKYVNGYAIKTDADIIEFIATWVMTKVITRTTVI